jgi:DNA-binding transcriptional regulator YdaS (Cro superfamily)
MVIRKRKAAAMTLADWLKTHDKTQLWMADSLGVSVATMSRIVRGLSMPRAALALDIQRLTEGAVTVESMARARAAVTPRNRVARIQQARALMNRGAAMLAAVGEE